MHAFLLENKTIPRCFDDLMCWLSGERSLPLGLFVKSKARETTYLHKWISGRGDRIWGRLMSVWCESY